MSVAKADESRTQNLWRMPWKGSLHQVAVMLVALHQGHQCERQQKLDDFASSLGCDYLQGGQPSREQAHQIGRLPWLDKLLRLMAAPQVQPEAVQNHFGCYPSKNPDCPPLVELGSAR